MDNPGGEKKYSRPQAKWIVYFLAVSVFVSSVFGAAFGFLAGGILSVATPELIGRINPFSGSGFQVGSDITRRTIIEEESAIIATVEAATPAVVSIVVTRDVPRIRNFFGDPFDDFFGPGGQEGQGDEETRRQRVGGGTGFFISSDGKIITNRHVVSDQSADYTVITSEGTEYQASLLAVHPQQDVAVIKIEGSGFPTLSLGDSDNLKVGQIAIAIGNSLGEFSNSVSKGVISGLRRNVTAGASFGQSERLTGIIQTDAAINPGNSGGPLLDISGNVIGVNVAMARGAQNVGFAIPINQVKNTIEQVESTGRISIPLLGVRHVLVDNQLQMENGLPVNYGALVLRGEGISESAVVPGSPAEKAGIRENDIILEIDGTRIDEVNSLGDLISRKRVGDEISVKFWQAGETKEVRVILEERM